MRSLNVPWQNPTSRPALGPLRRVVLAGGLILCTAALAMAGTLKGTVTNGTTKQPVASAEVVLMELQTGMVPVGKVKTDAHGRFQFTNAALGKAHMLLETTYRGVSYYHSVNPGDGSAAIEVYNSSSDPKSITIASRAIMLRDSGANLNVEEQYVVENLTKPPVAFYTPKSTFTFSIPDGARLDQVSSWTASRIPTVRKTIDAPNHRKAIDWAFHPGKSVVRISYVLPYSSKRAIIRTQSPYSVTHVFLAAPPGIELQSEGFNMIGTEEGYNIYARQSVPAESALVISVSGVASPAPAGTSGAQGTSGNTSGANVTTLPARQRNLTWILAICAAVLLFLGTMYFWRKSAARQALATAPGSGTRSKGNAEDRQSVTESAAERLDRIKDQLLQLELRHQAGTLSEEDYARERRQVEETLRSLLKG